MISDVSLKTTKHIQIKGCNHKIKVKRGTLATSGAKEQAKGELTHFINTNTSKNIKLKEELENKYDNIEVIINKNIGMGASNNIGIKRSKTKYAYIINPDVKFNNDTLEKLFEASESINDFAVISPISSDLNYPNYKKSNDSR